MKFKVGDKVHIESGSSIGNGVLVRIDSEQYPSWPFIVEVDGNKELPWYCMESELSIIKPFVIGDQVKIIRHLQGRWPESVGKTGIVTRNYGDIYYVNIPGYDMYATCAAEEIEKFEEGAFSPKNSEPLVSNKDKSLKVGDLVQIVGHGDYWEGLTGTIRKFWEDSEDVSVMFFDGPASFPVKYVKLLPALKAKPETLEEISAEVKRARIKFPKNEHLLAALMEEVGEVAKAYLEGEPIENIRNEACQVAAVAVRIIEEGDSDFNV
jgi:ribosomal protein L21E